MDQVTIDTINMATTMTEIAQAVPWMEYFVIDKPKGIGIITLKNIALAGWDGIDAVPTDPDELQKAGIR